MKHFSARLVPVAVARVALRCRSIPAIVVAALLSLSASAAWADDSVSISDAKKDERGFLVHEVRSPHQAKPTLIRVLLPDGWSKDKKYPVIYLLPVEAGTEQRYGDSLVEVKKRGLHNAFGAIFVAMTFAHLPWYADHPTRPELRQERYLLEVIVPFVEKTYPVRADRDGRLLLGFSKSGWGAWSLLLRHPERFGKAAAWDAPLMMDRPGKYGSGEIFGDEENFGRYRISKLLEERAEQVKQGERFVLLGYGNFRGDHQKTHELMGRLRIDHVYRDGPARSHDWHSGWVAEAVEALVGKRAE